MIPCGKTELSLFDPIPVQTSVTSASFVDYYPISDIKRNTPIEFNIPGTQDDYIDLNDTALYISLRVTDEAGKDLVAADLVAPTNFTAHSLFKDVSLALNDSIVSGGDNLYAYKAVMNNLLLMDQATKNTQLRALGYCQEEQFDVLNAKRVKWIAKSKNLELYTPLHLDMMNQTKYLVPSVGFRLKLTRHSDSFSLFSLLPKHHKCRIIIDQAVLFLRRVKCTPSVLEGHEIGLERMNAVYPLNHMEMNTFTVGGGQQSTNKENCLRGRLPKMVVIGMVTNAAFNGDFTKDPFNFQHFGLTYLGLFREGESIPYRQPLQLDFDNNSYLRAYMNNIHALEQFNRKESNGITPSQFKNGHSLFAFNLTPDLSMGDTCTQPYRNGNIRLEMKFSKALAQTINVIVYGIYDSSLQITKSRNIQIDYV